VGELGTEYPSAAACLADDLPALTVHLAYPLRLRKRLRSTNLLSVNRPWGSTGRWPPDHRADLPSGRP
jgi:hypothetical protein